MVPKLKAEIKTAKEEISIASKEGSAQASLDPLQPAVCAPELGLNYEAAKRELIFLHMLFFLKALLLISFLFFPRLVYTAAKRDSSAHASWTRDCFL